MSYDISHCLFLNGKFVRKMLNHDRAPNVNLEPLNSVKMKHFLKTIISVMHEKIAQAPTSPIRYFRPENWTVHGANVNTSYRMLTNWLHRP